MRLDILETASKTNNNKIKEFQRRRTSEKAAIEKQQKGGVGK